LVNMFLMTALMKDNGITLLTPGKIISDY
jgi:hypothetical protein